MSAEERRTVAIQVVALVHAGRGVHTGIVINQAKEIENYLQSGKTP